MFNVQLIHHMIRMDHLYISDVYAVHYNVMEQYIIRMNLQGDVVNATGSITIIGHTMDDIMDPY